MTQNIAYSTAISENIKNLLRIFRHYPKGNKNSPAAKARSRAFLSYANACDKEFKDPVAVADQIHY